MIVGGTGERMSVREKEKRVTRREKERGGTGESRRARCKKEGIYPSAHEIKGRDKRGEENASEIKGTYGSATVGSRGER